jgi:ribosome biogenesis protein ERB1
MKGKRQNKLEEFIMKSENKNWWRTVRDELNMRDVVLTDEQLVLIDRIRSGKMASKTIATSNYSVEIKNEDPFPVNAFPPSKRSFMPSKWERLKVNKILDGLLSGRIPWVPDQQPKEAEQLYDAWASGTVPERGVINIAPMRQKLPGHN